MRLTINDIPEAFKKELETTIDKMSDHQIKIQFKDITQNNKTQASMIISPMDMQLGNIKSGICPVMDLGLIYVDYIQEKVSIDEICEEMVDFYNKTYKELYIPQNVDFSNYEKCKQNLDIILYNPNININLPDEILKEKIDDLYAVPIINVFSQKNNQIGYIKINKDLLKLWGKTKDEIIAQCFLNAFDINKIMISPYLESINSNELFHDYPDMLLNPLFAKFNDIFKNTQIVSNKDNTFGAVKIFSPDILDMLYKKSKTDLFIIPNSVNEFFIQPAPKNENILNEYKRQCQILSECNYELDPKEVVNNHIYVYSGQKRTLFYLDENENIKIVDISKYSKENLEQILRAINEKDQQDFNEPDNEPDLD